MIGNLLRLVTREDQSDWDDQVAYCTFAYNATRHSTTKFLPHEIVFGLRKLYLPCDATLQPRKAEGTGLREALSNTNQAEQYRAKMDGAFEQVKENMQRVQQSNSRRNESVPILCQYSKERKSG